MFSTPFAPFRVQLSLPQCLCRKMWFCTRTCVLKTWTCPRVGCLRTTLAAALPTNQSPPRTSKGDPFREYGCMVAAIIGNLENMARPAPRAPLWPKSLEVQFGGVYYARTCRRTLRRAEILKGRTEQSHSPRTPRVLVALQCRSRNSRGIEQ